MFNKRTSAFTLIEVIVSITIFSIMIVSIIFIYVSWTDITLKSDINRSLHENLKIVSNTIAEDIRKNWIQWVSSNSSTPDCDFVTWTNWYKSWNKLCSKWWNSYYLAKFNNTTWDYIRIEDSECIWLSDRCSIVLGPDKPLTNSYISIKKLTFYISNDYVPKVTINILAQPSIKKWVKTDLIKDSVINFQTTISERPF